MRKRSLVLAFTAAALSVLLTVSVVAAATNGSGKGSSKADQVRAHWTPDRLKNATPRDFVISGQGRIIPQPGKGNGRGKPGGDDSGSSEVTGASWTTPGLVKSATGKIFFEIGNSGYVCSGAVVTDSQAGQSLVLTAGHCLFDEGSSGTGFVNNLVFIPDFDSDPDTAYYACTTPEELGIECWVAEHLVTSAKWASGDSDKWSEDYGFAVVTDAMNAGLSLEAEVGSFPINTDGDPAPQSIHAFGYPAAKKYNGADLVYCAGEDGRVNDGNPQTSSIKCKMTGGSSGGPWLLDFDPATETSAGIRSLTSYSYSSANGYLFGPIFDQYTQGVFAAADGAIGSDLVIDENGNIVP